jgi:hypothetical protein
MKIFFRHAANVDNNPDNVPIPIVRLSTKLNNAAKIPKDTPSDLIIKTKKLELIMNQKQKARTEEKIRIPVFKKSEDSSTNQANIMLITCLIEQ